MEKPVTHLPIIVLAAGRSRRMRGADKLMEGIDGIPLVRRQAEIAREVTSGPVIVALPATPSPRRDALAGLDVDPLPVREAAEGMGASLRTAFAALPPDAPAAMLLLGDLPEITADDLRRVLADVDLADRTLVWRGATQDGAPGHPIVFAAALFDDLKRLTGDDGGRAVVAKAGANVRLVFLAGHRARRDLDTPEDWAAWRAEQRGR
ncbi:nucleotidyltransferase family protein [Sulfitobacter sp. D35]|uniref:nucleotidyltransferase family protein n=1 Tax=Sulfitobacter sp. D35 TaxID=3083252 RepID=UPI00296EE9D5|nr:nucleotidyltransferase family protein [Sulfitobacter sp. D35]MDW4497708.1 nucleotidyltransferase family protein [Sulfitobacter sp. D35]